ncbi:MAG: hypothetical protein LBR15_10805 [Methanobrevibacter sp.]|nr:hypothetical protein [Candidatus Methanovirga australis]
MINKKSNIVALACTEPPEERREWTINLIAETLKSKEGLSFKLRKC